MFPRLADVLPPGWAATPTARAAAFHAVFVGSVTALKSATNALYLANRPPDGLPLLYVVVAGVVALATGLLAGPLSRFTPRELLEKAALLFTAAVALLVALFLAGVPSVLGALYVCGELYGTCLSILFWSTVSGWFDARSARKAFGLISAGGMAGAMVGGLAVRFTVALVGASGTAVIAAAMTLLALRWLTGDTLPVSTAHPRQNLFSGAMYLVRHRFPRAVASLAAAYAALGACVDYVFRAESAQILSEAELATLFGDLNAAVGVAAIAYQLVLTGRVLERGGLFLFLSVVPALLAVVSVVAGATHWFGAIIGVKALEMAGSFSIQQSGMQLLYNPMPAEARPAVRAFVDGLVKKGGMALAGVVLALVVTTVPAAASPWLVALMALGCLGLIRWMRGAYLVALEDKLRGSRAAIVTPIIDVEDRITRAALVRALSSESGRQVVTALAILRRDRHFKPLDHLTELLTHGDESVRLAAMELVPDDPPPDVEFALASILSLDSRRPRAAAARVLARTRPEKAAHSLRRHLDDPDPGVVCAVIAALHPLDETRADAERRFHELAGTRDAHTPAERREVARLLGEMPPALSLPYLPAAFSDEDASVRLLALQSAGQLVRHAIDHDAAASVLPLVPAIQARLAARSDRAAARAALVQLGDHAVPLLRANLDDRTLPLAVRIEIPRLLRAIGTSGAAGALLFSNIVDHPSLRYRIAESLFRLRRRHPEIEIDRERTDEACLRRIAGFAHYRPLCHALAAADATAPKGGPARRAWDVLRHLTTDRLMQNLEMALHLLGLHRGVERMDRAAALLMEAERLALRGPVPADVAAQRADALEVIDVALSGDPLRESVMRVLEPPPAAADQVNVPFRTVAETARALRVSQDPLVSMMARRVLRSGLIEPDEPSLPKDLSAPLRAVPPPPPQAAGISDPTDLEVVQSMDEALVARILTLEQVDIFAGLPVDDVAAIAGIAEERHAQPGEVLYKEGDPGDYMMVLVSGRVQLIRAGHVFMELGPGESIGQVSLLDRGPRPTTAMVAARERLGAELLSISYDAFMDLVTDRPELVRGLFVVLARRLRALIDLQAGPQGG